MVLKINFNAAPTSMQRTCQGGDVCKGRAKAVAELARVYLAQGKADQAVTYAKDVPRR